MAKTKKEVKVETLEIVEEIAEEVVEKSVDFLPLRNAVFSDIAVRSAGFTIDGKPILAVSGWTKKPVKGHVGTLARQTVNGGGVVRKYNADQCRTEFSANAEDLRAFADEVDASIADSIILVAVSEFALGERSLPHLRSAYSAATQLTAGAEAVRKTKETRSNALIFIDATVENGILLGTIEADSRDAKIAEMRELMGL